MAEHTPTPWVEFVIDGKCVAIMPVGRSRDICEFRVSPSDADVAFIVKAVNSHEELVEALKEAVHRLEGVWDDVGYQFDGDFTAPEDGLIARLHKVLSVATEPRP